MDVRILARRRSISRNDVIDFDKAIQSRCWR